MTEKMFRELIDRARLGGKGNQTTELRDAEKDCPHYLFSTISAFSNQEEGGVIIFGIRDSMKHEICGVYDARALIRKVTEQCEQMEPVITPIFTKLTIEGKTIIAAEIPSLDINSRPCHYRGKGSSYSFIRDCHENRRMTDYELHDLKTYRDRISEDIRTADNIFSELIDREKEEAFLSRCDADMDACREAQGLSKDGKPTLLSLIMFGKCPQVSMPGLRIEAERFSGELDPDEEGFRGDPIKKERIIGNIPEMLEKAMVFFQENTEGNSYPEEAVREALINALEHRDYSHMTDFRPIRMKIFSDRMVIGSPGKLWGNASLPTLGKKETEPRNRHLMSIMEILGLAGNGRHGIEVMRDALSEAGMPAPIFRVRDDSFTVTFRKEGAVDRSEPKAEEENLLSFLSVPRTRREIASFLHLDSQTYAIRTYITPLVKRGIVELSIPEHPRSSNQTYLYRE